MELAKVIGQVVSTVRCPGLPYNSLLLVDLLNEKGESIGRSQVAADPIGAGEGEWVIVSRCGRFAAHRKTPVFRSASSPDEGDKQKKQAPRPAVLKVPRGPASSIGV